MADDLLAPAALELLGLPARVSRIEAGLARVEQLLSAILKRLPPRLLSVRETAEAFDISEPTVRRRIADGSLVARRIGRSVRVDIQEESLLSPPDVVSLAHCARSEIRTSRREQGGNRLLRVPCAKSGVPEDTGEKEDRE